MQMRCAIGDGVIQPYVPLKPLMQISSLCDVDRNPIAVLGLPGIDVIAGQRLELGIKGKDLVLIFVAREAEPTAGTGRCAFLVRVTTKQLFYQVHLILNGPLN